MTELYLTHIFNRTCRRMAAEKRLEKLQEDLIELERERLCNHNND